MLPLLLIGLIGSLLLIQVVFLFFIIRHGRRINKNREKNELIAKTLVTHENEQIDDIKQYSSRTYYNDQVLRNRQRKLEKAVFGT